jgi:hypothetical protein
MALRSLERLKSAFVVVPPLGEVTYIVNPAEVGKHLRDPLIQNLQGNVLITSVRDQIVVKLGPRIEFEDQSDTPAGGGRLPDVATAVLNMVAFETYRAYGWNFDVAFDAPGEESASALISHSFLNGKAFSERAQVSPLGASIFITFDQGTARCGLTLESLNRDLNTPRFHGHINYHYELQEGQALPSLDELRIMHNGLYGSFIELLDRLVR